MIIFGALAQMLGMLLFLLALCGIAFVIVLIAKSIFLPRYKQSRSPLPHWVATDEVFKDPGSGKYVRVYVDPYNSERHYVEDRHY